MIETIIYTISLTSAAVIMLLGFLAFFTNYKSKVNQIFLVLTLSVSGWIISVVARFLYFSDQSSIVTSARVTFAFPILIGISLYYFTYYFPIKSRGRKLNTLFLFIIGSLIITASIFTPFIVETINVANGIQYDTYGFAYFIFIVFFISLLILSIVNLTSKRKYLDQAQKTRMRLVLTGFVTSIVLALLTNVFIPLITKITIVAVSGPSMVVIFISLTSYAILKHSLFNIKVIATELFVFSLWLFILIRTLIANDPQEQIVNSILLILTVILGIFVIRSVLQEVRTREEIQKLVLKLEEANTELKKLDEAKSEFINIASHQLRTPLTIIKGYISMANEGVFGKVDKKLHDTLKKVYLSNERLITLVADLLDLSRIERKKMQYEFMSSDITKLVDSLAIDFEHAAEQKGLKLKWKKPKNIPRTYADIQKLRQVFLNIIDNSVKYTDKGTVEIELLHKKDEIIFSVKDTGMGMNEAETKDLFKKFVRGQVTQKVKTEGMGLGMYVAKLIIEAHKGKIWAESPGKGKGSTFFVSLPVTKPPAKDKPTLDKTEEFIRNF